MNKKKSKTVRVPGELLDKVELLIADFRRQEWEMKANKLRESTKEMEVAQ